MTTTLEKAFSVGKYLVSPSSKAIDTGGFSAALSIRSGQGRGTHDRVFRFVPHFSTSESALRYARQQGQHMVQHQQLA